MNELTVHKLLVSYFGLVVINGGIGIIVSKPLFPLFYIFLTENKFHCIIVTFIHILKVNFMLSQVFKVLLRLLVS